jgi:hypothetical protein
MNPENQGTRRRGCNTLWFLLAQTALISYGFFWKMLALFI